MSIGALIYEDMKAMILLNLSRGNVIPPRWMRQYWQECIDKLSRELRKENNEPT